MVYAQSGHFHFSLTQKKQEKDNLDTPQLRNDSINDDSQRDADSSKIEEIK